MCLLCLSRPKQQQVSVTEVDIWYPLTHQAAIVGCQEQKAAVRTLCMQVCECSGQHPQGAALAAEGLAHGHETVPDHNHLVQLNGLHQEVLVGLQVVGYALLLHGDHERRVVRGGQHNA